MSMSSVHVQIRGIFERMKTIPAGEFKQTCLRLLDEVGASGEPILITKRGKPVAQLTPVKPQRAEDWSGAMRDRGEVRGDLVAPAAAPGEWDALRE
jgi:prevent-host-death family protein